MPNALDDRPLQDRLNARIQKYSGCTTKPLVTDIALHRQSAEELGRLMATQAYLAQALRPLLAHWDDVQPGESENIDRARAALAKATQ